MSAVYKLKGHYMWVSCSEKLKEFEEHKKEFASGELKKARTLYRQTHLFEQ